MSSERNLIDAAALPSGAMPHLFESYPRRRSYASGINSERVRFVPVVIDNKNNRRSAIASILRPPRLRERAGAFAKFNLLNKFEKSQGRSIGGFADHGSMMRKLAFAQRRGRGAFPFVREAYPRVGHRGALRMSGGRRRFNNAGASQEAGVARHPRKPWRGGQQRRGEQVTTEKLDEDLDRYMGEDVRKSRLDTELDAYFANQPGDLLIKSGETEAGEIMQ